MPTHTVIRFTPLDTHDAANPVLYIRHDAPLEDLAICAAHRFTVVRDLMDTLSTLGLKNIDDCDLLRVSRGSHLLMREGCALLEIIQVRAARMKNQ